MDDEWQQIQVGVNLIMFHQINIETQRVSKDKFNQQFYTLYKLLIIQVHKLKRPFEIQCIVKMYLHPQIWSPDEMSMNKTLTVVFHCRLYSTDYSHAYINNYDFRNIHYACFSANNNYYQTFILTLSHKCITAKGILQNNRLAAERNEE